MKKRSRKKHSKLLLPLIVFFLGSAGLLALCLLLVVRDTPTNPAVPNEIESALDTLEKKNESIPTSIQQFEAPVQITREDSLNPQILQSYKEQDINGILKKHVEAMGGWANWQKVESIRTSGTIERGDQTFPVVIIKKRPHRIRATITVPVPGKENESIKLIRAHSDGQAWSATRLAGDLKMRKEALPLEAAKELFTDAGVLPPLIKFWQEGATVELVGLDSIAGEPHYKMRIASTQLTSDLIFYLSCVSHLVTQYESVQQNKIISRTILKNYRNQQGVLIPTLNITQADQTGQTIMTTPSIKIGVGIYQEYFSADPPLKTANL